MKYGVMVGATSDIAQVCIQKILDRGTSLFLCSRNRASLEAIASKWDLPFKVIENYSFSEMEAAFKEAQNYYQDRTLEMALCMSGSLILKPAHLVSEEELDSAIDANFKAAFATLRSAVSRMQNQGGSIVLMSSVAAQLGLANHEAIGAVKSAVEGLTRSAAATYARYKIRVNAVAPALTQTKLTQKFTTQEAVLKASQKMHPLGRIGQADDIASAIQFLLSQESGWITGQTIRVDGGLSKIRSN